jgi:hypothetical protein
MNEVTLQLVTVALDNGESGIFIGGPLVTRSDIVPGQSVATIRFSDIQQIPGDVTLEQALMLFAEQVVRNRTRLQ